MTIGLLALSYFSIFLCLKELAPIWNRLRALFVKKREVDRLRQGILVLRGLQDRLETGLLPEKSNWEEVRAISGPWGEVFYQTLTEARDRGAPVLPSLSRMQRLLEEQAQWLTDASTKLAPAMGQAMLALILVPLFAFSLWKLLPGLEQQAFAFFCVVAIALLMGLAAFYWMTEMGERARYGQLPMNRRTWIASATIALERLNALVMVGQPPDLAWNEVLEELHRREPELAIRWGSMVWGVGREAPVRGVTAESILIELGHEVRRLIQTSLIEGQAALDRIESVQRAFLMDLRGRIEQDLAKLGNQSLKPLFILVMPAILLLMAVAMMITMQGAWL